jgi:SAM-dependent methyltransferase
MFALSKVKSVARAVLPEGVAQTLRDVKFQLQTVRMKGLDFRLELPNRRVLEDTILTGLAHDPQVKSVLFVGCRWYTKTYADLLKGKDFWTIEIDPDQAKFGATNHIIDSYLNLSQHVAPGAFDAIVLNGVFGWGIDTPADTELALAETLRALSPGGQLVIGYNDTPDNYPSFLDSPSAVLGLFEPVVFAPLGGADYKTPGDPGNHTFTFHRKPRAAA